MKAQNISLIIWDPNFAANKINNLAEEDHWIRSFLSQDTLLYVLFIVLHLLLHFFKNL